MSPEHIAEGQDNTGHEAGSKTRESDSPTLESGDTSAISALTSSSGSNLPDRSNGTNTLSQNNPPIQDLSDLISDNLLAHADPLMALHLAQLREQYESSMQMHRHYKEIAVNGTEADIGPTSADDLALDYLRQCESISRNITMLVSKMMETSTKKAIEHKKLNAKTPQQPQAPHSLTQNNTVINFGEANRRTQIRMMEEMAGKRKLNGTLGLPSPESLVASVTNTEGAKEKNEAEDDAE